MPGSDTAAREANFYELPSSDLQQHPQVWLLTCLFQIGVHLDQQHVIASPWCPSPGHLLKRSSKARQGKGRQP